MSACVTLCVALVAATNLATAKLAGSSLHPSATGLLWIVDAYVLVFACLLIPAGALGDRLGRKGALLAGLAVFATGCALSALAPGTGALIAARALTGAGAALVMPATLALALHCAGAERRPHAIAVWTAATGIAGTLGNLGGGLALQFLPWRGLFWSVTPIALLLLALAARRVPRVARHPAPVDPLGTALLAGGFLALLFGIVEGPERGWRSAVVLGALAVAALLLAAFAGHGLRAAHPLVDPRLFAAPGLRAGVLGLAAVFFGLFSLFYVNAQYLQLAKGYSPALTGAAIAPIGLGMLVSARAAVLARRLGPGPLVAAGFLALAAGLILLSLLDRHTPYPAYAALLLLLALGMGLAMPPLSAAVVNALPDGRGGLGAGLGSAAREIGSALGVAVVGTVLAGHHSGGAPGRALAASAGGAGDATAFTDAMSVAFRVVAAVFVVLAVPVLRWLRRAGGTPGFGADAARHG
ncbi:MFS transporter [Streptomyces hoynatensis]|nr:MFS transporter [Streptomyces hoynatensis]